MYIYAYMKCYSVVYYSDQRRTISYRGKFLQDLADLKNSTQKIMAKLQVNLCGTV